jgi:hypothetical protein
LKSTIASSRNYRLLGGIIQPTLVRGGNSLL